MLSHYEKRRARYVESPGALQSRHLGTRKKLPLAAGTTRTDHPNGCGWSAKPRYRSGTGCLPANRAALAATFPRFSTGGAGKGCSPSWSYSQDSGEKDSCSHRSHSPYNATQCNPLEHSQHGQGSRVKRGHDTPYMETTQPEAPFDQNVQGQPRQTICRETVRRCWALFKSSGQVAGALCRRKESDPSSRPDAAGVTDEERPLWDHDTRLQTQRHNNVICGTQHARRYDYRRLPAAPSASRIYPFPQENRRRDPGRSRPTLDRGQLRDTQASQREDVAQTTFTIPFALYPDLELLVEHGRAVVPRDYRQTYPSWHVSECTRFNRGYQKLYRQPQPKSAGVCMDCTCGTDFDQGCQK